MSMVGEQMEMVDNIPNRILQDIFIKVNTDGG